MIPVNIEGGGFGQLGGGTIVSNWGGQNIQQVVYPAMTTVINQSDQSQVQKAVSGQTQIQVQQLQHTPAKRNSPSKGSQLKSSGSVGRKKRQWKSLVLRKSFPMWLPVLNYFIAPEIIPISPNGTWEKPELERIAPGQNYKDMRTWVFYLSVHGRLFKAVIEKILHEKQTAYLTCSNAKKKALQEKCKWRGRLFMKGMLLYYE